MKLQSVQSFIAPLATPLAPALLFANETYMAMVAVDIPYILALAVAAIAIIGIEFSGALMCYNAIEAWRQKQKSKMALAIIGAIIYSLIMMAGIATADNKRVKILSLTVLLTLIAYLAYAIYESLRKQENTRQQNVEIQLGIMKERRLMKNAEIREIKAQSGAKNLAKSSKSEQIAEQTKTSKFVAECEFCGWKREYETRRGAINGKNGHMRTCKGDK